MWLTIAITSVLFLILILLLKPGNEPINGTRKAWIFFTSVLIWLFTIVVVSFNSDFITDTINHYHKGKIIKVETITIKDLDTTKVVKYKYK